MFLAEFTIVFDILDKHIAVGIIFSIYYGPFSSLLPGPAKKKY